MTRNTSILSSLLFITLAAGISSCCDDEGIRFRVTGFNPTTNVKGENNFLLDYTDAIDSGFIIPTIRQLPNGAFTFNFTVNNNSDFVEEYFYKIYYQNETYKMPEGDALSEGAYNGENFYGSWESTEITFKPLPPMKPGQQLQITDSFRITGNPRNEQIYYGPVSEEKYPPSVALNEKTGMIRSDTAWFSLIRSKAITNNITLEQQLVMDGTYLVNEERKSDSVNNRWQRNPRVGDYSIMLVVTTKADLGRIPVHYKNIGLKVGNRFASPYYFFTTGKGSKLRETIVSKVDRAITVIAKPDLAAGIYISKGYFRGFPYSREFFSSTCNDDSVMYQQAAFTQFVHAVDTSLVFPNIPTYTDFEKNDFGPAAYNKTKTSFPKEQMVPTRLSVTDCPCKTVSTDIEKKQIVFKTPGNKPGEFRKENTGLVSRHGFTYGKYTAKVKFAKLLNSKKVWNGLTNAFWLINHGDDRWGARRNCNKVGYIKKTEDGEYAPRVPGTAYAEIDFEIRKTSRYWAATSYHKGESLPVDDRSDSDKVIVTCTNWDLACQQPADYNAGLHHLDYKGQDIQLHRWTHWYKALTSKKAESDDEMFGGEFYYFQLEWKPGEIIWRIGPSKDRLRVVGYMNDRVTSIPNNQMLMVFTQEYHPSQWWPQSQYEQEYIPFLMKDLEGRIFEVEIE